MPTPVVTTIEKMWADSIKNQTGKPLFALSN
jgi:hypothetical protein